MTEVVPADRTSLLQERRTEFNAIVKSRKRKLRELWTVASSVDTIPNIALNDANAPSATTAEKDFLERNDILQGRTFIESSVPTRPHLRSDSARQKQVAQAATVAPKGDVATALSKHEAVQSTSAAPVTVGAAHDASPEGKAGSAVPGPVPGQPGETETKVVPAATPAQGTKSSSTPAPRPQPAAAVQPVAQKDGIQSNEKKDESRKPLESIQNVGQQGKPDDCKVKFVDQDQADPDRMDVDEVDAQKPEDSKPLSLQLPGRSEASRHFDGASSPESMVHSATTPAIHEASTDTSPEHEGLGDMDKDVEKSDDGRPSDSAAQDQPRTAVPAPTAVSISDAKAASSDNLGKHVEAQLLQDSASVVSAAAPPTDQAGATPGIIVGQATRQATEIPDSQDQSPTDKMDIDEPSNADQEQDLAAPGVPSNDTRDALKVETQPDQGLPSTSSRAERAVTRVSSGAIQKKSVSEILGEQPKAAPPSRSADDSLLHDAGHDGVPLTPTSQSPRPRSRSLQEKSKIKDKSKLSTVVFGKQAKRPAESEQTLVQRSPKAGQLPSDDYFTPLFVQSFASNSKWMKPLETIIQQAHKTLSTPDIYAPILDNQACRVLRRVYHLQHHDKWSLRQPKRCPEPARQESHWDVLLKEMKWMRTDFREERKWKRAVARNLAYACKEYAESSEEERKEMRINAVIPPKDVEMTNVSDAADPETHPTPDLIPSGGSDSPAEQDEEPPSTILDTIAPSAIFALENDDVVFALNPSPTADRLLEELPIFSTPLQVPKYDLAATDIDPDAAWKRPALPLTKYIEGRLDIAPIEPPKKRSRFRYAQEDEDDEVSEITFGDDGQNSSDLPPANPNVALFQPDNKIIRDRLHAGHQFRPPNEYAMPFQSFYESRSPSQWTLSEDDELKALVRQYSYNWSLISSILGSKSIFASGAERRTPWECFERWVMLEGLPHDMQKTQYFKLWQGRIEAAQQIIRQQNQVAMQQQAQQQQAQQQQAQQQQQQPGGSSGPVTPVARRRLSVPFKVERRRNQKHLTMIDAMRKLAKKRETAVAKQQHAASLAAMRKANEVPQPRAPTKTPREYSLMRWERDQAMAERLAERMAQHQQRQLEQRRAAMQARAQQGGPAAQLAAAQNASQMSQNSAQMGAAQLAAGIARANAPNQIPINGQARPRMPTQTTPNGTGTPTHAAGGLVPPLQINGGQVQMPVVNGQARMNVPTPDIQLVMQAQRISEQQRQAIQQQAQRQTHPNQQTAVAAAAVAANLQNSPPAAMRAAAVAAGLNQKSFMNNQAQAALLASFNAQNASGMSTPPGQVNMAGSPRQAASMPHPTHQHYLSQLQAIEGSLRQQSPNVPQEVIRQMAQQLLQSRQTNLAQSAMNAAAGGANQTTAMANGPHQYAQLLRQQQQQQQAAQAAQVAQHQRHSSGSATPTPTPSVPK